MHQAVRMYNPWKYFYRKMPIASTHKMRDNDALSWMMGRGKHYINRMAFLEFQMREKQNVRIDFFVVVDTRIYSLGCHLYINIILLY